MNNIQNNTIINKNDLRIIVSLAKIDTSNKLEHNMVCSIVQYPYPIYLNKIENNISFLNENTDFFQNRKFIVVHLCLDIVENGEDMLINENIFKLFKINIYEYLNLFNEFNYNIRIKDILENLVKFENKKGKEIKIEGLEVSNMLVKDNMENYNVIFIFDGITWSNIILLFKNMNISIYGGSSSRRHLLSTVHLNLVKFLDVLTNFQTSNDIIYRSFKEFSNVNSEYDKELVNLFKNYFESGSQVYEEALRNYPRTENFIFYSVHNLILWLYLKLLDLKKNIIALNKNNLNCNKEIELNKNIISKYFKEKKESIYFINNKVRNANKRIENITPQKGGL
jgi:hypothetical protein